MLSRGPGRTWGLKTQSRKTRAVEIEYDLRGSACLFAKSHFANDAAAELAANLVKAGNR